VDCKKGFPQIFADLGRADKKEIVQVEKLKLLGNMKRAMSKLFSHRGIEDQRR
jgi:hypothetical protein